jgi:RNA polymerase nonessential primary-like sigma factor
MQEIQNGHAPEIHPASFMGGIVDTALRHGKGSVPLLEAKQEVELAKRIEAGLYAEHLLAEGQDAPGASWEELATLARDGEHAKAHFIMANVGLVGVLARRYTQSELPLADRVQAGYGGLTKAIGEFDYTKGWKFSTFATWGIRKSISQERLWTERLVRLPVHVITALSKTLQAEEALTEKLGREPRLDELAAEMYKDPAAVEALLKHRQTHLSLDAPISPTSTVTRYDMMVNQEATDTPSRGELWLLLDQALDTLASGDEPLLSETERNVIRVRWGSESGEVMMRAATAEALGLSYAYVRKIERKAYALLNERFPHLKRYYAA